MSIRARTYYVTEIFMQFLAKIDLDGNDKLVIHFCEKPASSNKYVCDKYFHVSCYNVDKNVIDKSDTLKDDELDKFFLDIIVEACKYIARFNNRGEDVIKMIELAADKVRENKFELVMLQKGLSKLSGNKQYKASVYRNINRYGEMWYVEMENRNNKNIKRYQIMKQYAHISKTEFFKNSYWENEKFVLTDKFGRVVETIEMDNE